MEMGGKKNYFTTQNKKTKTFFFGELTHRTGSSEKQQKTTEPYGSGERPPQMEIPVEAGGDTGHKRARSASPEAGLSESLLIPEAIVQICLEGRGLRWDNGRICYEVQDPAAFESRYKELRPNKLSKWTWNHVDKYYSMWAGGKWSRKGSCFTPKDVHETKFWQKLALAPPTLFRAVDTHTHTEQEVARLNSLLDAACEQRQEKLGLQKRVKALEQDLAVAKQTCKDQEYHIGQVAAGGPDVASERLEWQAQRERLEARVRELEVLEMSWTQMRGIFNTKGPRPH
jgi:hypothetical protein